MNEAMVIIDKDYPSDDYEMDSIVESINTDIKHTDIILSDVVGRKFVFLVPAPISNIDKAILFDIAVSLNESIKVDEDYDSRCGVSWDGN